MRFVALIVALLTVTCVAWTAGRAHADSYGRARLYSFQLGVAVVEPIAGTRERLSSGLGLALGAELRPLPALAFQLAYTVSVFDVRSGVLPGASLEGDQLLQSWAFHVVFEPIHVGRAGFYLIAGPGMHLRDVDITAVQGRGVATVCDAWLLVCPDRALAIRALPGSRNALEFGLHAGLGADVAIDRHTRLYLEARYEVIWGDELSSRTGTVSHANQEYVPIVLGVDF